MSTDAEYPELESIEDKTLARHKRIAEVIDGKRSMDWSDWAMFIHESKYLTSDGQRVALWAAETLQHILKDDFFQRITVWLRHMRTIDPDLAPDAHPVFSFGLWPANDVPRVYANLIQLAAHIQLFNLNLAKNRFRRVLKTLHDNLEPISWGSTLLQLEIAGLGLRSAWNVVFEPALDNGKSADVHLTNGSIQLLIETTLMRMPISERRARAFFDRLLWQLHFLEWQHGVRISGSLSCASLTNDKERAQWFQDIEKVASATSQDGFSRQVQGPEKVLLTVFRPTEAMAGQSWEIVGDQVETRILDRLIAVLRDKNRQAEGNAIPVWVHLNESAGLWQSTRFQGITLAQTLEFLTGVLQEALASFPYLAGVILSPGSLWVGNTPIDLLTERIEHDGSIALRCPIPTHQARETIIVPQIGMLGTDPKIFADWYANEGTWLDWALEQLHYPPFNALVYEPLSESDL